MYIQFIKSRDERDTFIYKRIYRDSYRQRSENRSNTVKDVNIF